MTTLPSWCVRRQVSLWTIRSLALFLGVQGTTIMGLGTSLMGLGMSIMTEGINIMAQGKTSTMAGKTSTMAGKTSTMIGRISTMAQGRIIMAQIAITKAVLAAVDLTAIHIVTTFNCGIPVSSTPLEMTVLIAISGT